MRRFSEHKIIIFLIAATVIAAAVIGIFSARKGTTAVENAAGTVVSPMQSGASGAGGFFGKIGEFFGGTKELRDENEQLRAEVSNLRKMLQECDGLEKENNNLRAMLDLRKKQTRIDMVAASVAALDPSNWYSVFTINKGSKDGIKQNQPVVNSNRELIGQTMRVGENWAEVITLLDSQSAIGATIKRSKVTGIIEGDGALRLDGNCRFGYIARDADIQVGDYVETSGLGGIFPKGLVIGTVSEIYEENSTMSKAAIIDPLADISSISEVFVVTSYDEVDLSESESEGDEDSEDNNGDGDNESSEDEE